MALKPADLNDAAESVGFSYQAATGDDAQEDILNVGGYRMMTTTSAG